MSKLDWRTRSIPVDLATLVPSVLYRAALSTCGWIGGGREGGERERTNHTYIPMHNVFKLQYYYCAFLLQARLTHING